MKNILISGGSRGIGAELVRKFAECGDNVIFFYKNSCDMACEIENKYKNVKGIMCDVTCESDVLFQVEKIIKEYKTIDVLVNNAGVSWTGLLSEMTLDDWNFVINSDLTSVFLLSRALIPHFVSRKCGKIINISSMWGITGASCEVAYSAAKAGVIGFTKALAKELGPSGICVNCVAPGVIRTDMMASFGEDDVKALTDETPLGRIGTVSDVANAVYFLSEETSDFITGETINVNGGFII